MFYTIKQLEEKNVANEINCMVWSNRMDLVAFSNNISGELALHRLTWTRAWSLNPPKDNTTVSGIAWRPDGKVLAVAYNPGDVVLIDVETKYTITSFDISQDISFISWIQEKAPIKQKDVLKANDEESTNPPDLSKPYLRHPPIFSLIEGPHIEEVRILSNFLQDQTEFNILIVGTKEGLLYLIVFGSWTCVVIDVNKYIGEKCEIQNAHFTEDLSKIIVTVTRENQETNIVIFNSEIFKTHTKELYNVTAKYMKLHELLLYLEKVLVTITETWENILLEIDNKLSKYARKMPEQGVTAEFLELLMFGVCSEEMEEFLLHDLTKKGLEKFGQSMEISYSNIQSYLFRHIIKFAPNITYHLTDLKGMAQFKDRYGGLGLNTEVIQEAIRANAAFLIKAAEMQQIINHSVINYKAFFRWLYSSIMHLVDEPIPSDIQKMTQQDLACITEFLQNFDGYGGTEKKDSKFVMERIGQYIVDAPLTIKPDMSGNDWTEFLQENECLADNPHIFQHYTDKSLVQVLNQLKDSIDTIFKRPLNLIESQISHIHNLNCKNVLQGGAIKMSSINISSDVQVFCFLKPKKNICLLQMHIDKNGKCQARAGKFSFIKESQDSFNVVDIQFYSSSVLSILLEESCSPNHGVMLQFSLPCALDELLELDVANVLNFDHCPVINGFDFTTKITKNVDMSVSKFAVSGSRRVGMVLAENKKKIKLYEMECEEEDEEDTDMTNILKDMSMQESLTE
ncbi:anaphase-promoting complex subunit 4 [Cylas formicarius]|uniref:anaphase-promoting complex subunit 4 n=1 Tax=Cylas formicarius TaxID=197179 RepID=UPI002958BCC5|nr:anaphase-promoting complex subunit 4 [Cylas formicarius]